MVANSKEIGVGDKVECDGVVDDERDEGEGCGVGVHIDGVQEQAIVWCGGTHEGEGEDGGLRRVGGKGGDLGRGAVDAGGVAYEECARWGEGAERVAMGCEEGWGVQFAGARRSQSVGGKVEVMSYIGVVEVDGVWRRQRQLEQTDDGDGGVAGRRVGGLEAGGEVRGVGRQRWWRAAAATRRDDGVGEMGHEAERRMETARRGLATRHDGGLWTTPGLGLCALVDGEGGGRGRTADEVDARGRET